VVSKRAVVLCFMLAVGCSQLRPFDERSDAGSLPPVDASARDASADAEVQDAVESTDATLADASLDASGPIDVGVSDGGYILRSAGFATTSSVTASGGYRLLESGFERGRRACSSDGVYCTTGGIVP
jgi:hypothetical protein